MADRDASSHLRAWDRQPAPPEATAPTAAARVGDAVLSAGRGLAGFVLGVIHDLPFVVYLLFCLFGTPQLNVGVLVAVFCLAVTALRIALGMKVFDVPRELSGRWYLLLAEAMYLGALVLFSQGDTEPFLLLAVVLSALMLGVSIRFQVWRALTLPCPDRGTIMVRLQFGVLASSIVAVGVGLLNVFGVQSLSVRTLMALLLAALALGLTVGFPVMRALQIESLPRRSALARDLHLLGDTLLERLRHKTGIFIPGPGIMNGVRGIVSYPFWLLACAFAGLMLSVRYLAAVGGSSAGAK